MLPQTILQKSPLCSSASVERLSSDNTSSGDDESVCDLTNEDSDETMQDLTEQKRSAKACFNIDNLLGLSNGKNSKHNVRAKVEQSYDVRQSDVAPYDVTNISERPIPTARVLPVFRTDGVLETSKVMNEIATAKDGKLPTSERTSFPSSPMTIGGKRPSAFEQVYTSHPVPSAPISAAYASLAIRLGLSNPSLYYQNQPLLHRMSNYINQFQPSPYLGNYPHVPAGILASISGKHHSVGHDNMATAQQNGRLQHILMMHEKLKAQNTLANQAAVHMSHVRTEDQLSRNHHLTTWRKNLNDDTMQGNECNKRIKLEKDDGDSK